MKKNLFALFALAALTSMAQETDIEGSHDHPMISRMKNYLIGEYRQNYDKEELQISDGDYKEVEGDKTYLYYVYPESAGETYPSVYQVIKNHENAIRNIGGKKVYYDGGGYAVFNLKKNGADIWVKVQAVNSGAVYYLTIIEVNAMEQEITAAGIYKSISEQGSVALYINFETGKADIKPESQAVIEELASMLKENLSLKVAIEGHTDNTGNAAANKTLSLNRANAVMRALISKGIQPARMSAVGRGQEVPLGDNTTEEGRARNRRVEIVRK